MTLKHVDWKTILLLNWPLLDPIFANFWALHRLLCKLQLRIVRFQKSSTIFSLWIKKIPLSSIVYWTNLWFTCFFWNIPPTVVETWFHIHLPPWFFPLHLQLVEVQWNLVVFPKGFHPKSFPGHQGSRLWQGGRLVSWQQDHQKWI